MADENNKPDIAREGLPGFSRKKIVYGIIVIAVIVLAVGLGAKFGFNVDLLSPSSAEMAVKRFSHEDNGIIIVGGKPAYQSTGGNSSGDNAIIIIGGKQADTQNSLQKPDQLDTSQNSLDCLGCQVNGPDSNQHLNGSQNSSVSGVLQKE
jgi:hypothetical protein